MKRSNRLVILVGVLLAVLAFVAIVVLLNNSGDGGNGQPGATPSTVDVLVATEDIEIGDPVTPDKAEVQPVDPAAVLGTRIASLTQLSGQPALQPIPAGSQIPGEAVGLGSNRIIDISARLNPGEKAVAFSVDAVAGLDFLIEEGDEIDLIVSQDVPAVQETADSAANTDPEAVPRFEPVVGLENLRSVKAVLQNKRVLYVSATKATTPEPTDTNGDGVIDENDTPPAQASPESVIIIFAGTDQDAEIIKFAQGQEASISAIARHADDDAEEETLGITLRQLVDEFGLLVPDVIQLQVEAAE